MQVTRYQMHNVLDCYRKKLSHAHAREGAANGFYRKSADEIAMSSDTGRIAAMDKISRQVLDKVLDVVALSNTGKSSRYSLRESDAVVGGAVGAAPMECPAVGTDSIER